MAGSPEGYVFKAIKIEGFMPRNSLAGKVRSIFHRAGLTGKKLGPHTLRHSGASLIARNTKSALVVQQKLQDREMTVAMGYVHDAEKLAVGVSVLDTMSIKPIEQKALVPVVEGDIIEAEDLTDKMFDRITENVRIRPALVEKDLSLLRSVMVDFTRAYRGDSRVYECQSLFKRILRKVKICVDGDAVIVK
jgi:hypothetical protein